MFDEKKHAELIVIGDEHDLAPKNLKRLEAWRKAFAKNKRQCDVLRFMPSRKQFYEGGVSVTLWPGFQEWDMTNGRNKVTPSDIIKIDKFGYCPKDEREAIRLLFLMQTPSNRLCLYEDRELEGEAKASELENQRLKSENAAMREEMEALKAKLEARK